MPSDTVQRIVKDVLNYPSIKEPSGNEAFYAVKSDFSPLHNNILVSDLIKKSKEFNIVSVTGDYLLGDDDDLILCDASSAALTVTLPTPSTLKSRQKHIKKIDSSSNPVTVSGTVDGQSTTDIVFQYDSMSIIPRLGTYHII